MPSDGRGYDSYDPGEHQHSLPWRRLGRPVSLFARGIRAWSVKAGAAWTMSIFKRRQAATGGALLPTNIARLMERAGRYEFDPEGSDEDSSRIWSETQAPLVALATADPVGFIDTLAAAVLPVGGWAVYGAAHTLWDVLPEAARARSSYDAIMSASLEFLRSNGVPPNRLTGFEWDHWIARGGTAESWVPMRPQPSHDEGHIGELDHAETRHVATMTAEADANRILVQRTADDRYVAVIEAKRSSDDPRRVRNDWLFAGSLNDLYAEIGRALQAPPYWEHDELEPFFPLPPPKLRRALDGYGPIDDPNRAYDLFLSHATEDKDFVRPIYEALAARGVKTWYDEAELQVGDSLRQSIDQGLTRSRFGVVVISRAFFAKNWTSYELNGLVAREMQGRKVILPVWHPELTTGDVIVHSPSLADKKALLGSQLTVDEIADELTALVLDQPA